MKQLQSFRDIEKLSAYLDNRLSRTDRARLESRLESEPQLEVVLKELQQARFLLKKTPSQHVPRNFYLTPKMAGIRPPLPRSVPVFRFASLTAAVILFFTFAINFISPIAAAPRMNFNAVGMGGGCDSSISGNCGDVVQTPPPGTGYGGGPQDTSTPEALSAMPVAPLIAGTSTPESTLESSLRTMEQPTEVASVLQTEEQATVKSSEDTSINQPLLSDFHLGLIALFIIFGAIALVIRQLTITKWQKRQ
jgi:hypothetical protein